MRVEVHNNNFLLYSVMFLVLVYVARVQELFLFLAPLHVGKVSILLALLLFFFVPKDKTRVSLLKIHQIKMVLAILALCIISVPFSVYKGQSFEMAVLGFPRTILFFILLVYAVNTFQDLRKMVWVFIAGALLLALFTILGGTSQGGRMSASGTYDPNDIAMLFVIALPIVYFFMSSRKGIAKVVLSGALLTLLFAFILTVSRGGFIGLMVIALLILFKDRYRSWVVKLAVLAVLTLAFVQFAPDTYWDRMKTITSEDDYNLTADYGRKQLWLRGLGLMLDNPVTGVGAGAFMTGLGYSYGDAGGKWLTAHNAFVQIGAELGVGGFVLFILLILTSIRWMRRLRNKYASRPGDFKNHLWLITALEVSLWGYVATAMFLSAAYFAMFYFLIALCCILRKLDLMEEFQSQSAVDGHALQPAGVKA
ncbi:MAG: O-antigen ligase family protein [Desulfomicrobium sp.]|nr:O-antigen ligase family protein [Desulfomicrobium sp.]